MRKYFFILLTLFFIPAALLFASDTRVGAAGTLSLVLTDESVEINPFLFGNPAGVALIEPVSRFDIAGQWFSLNSAATNTTDRFYGTLGNVNSVSTNYHGLLLFPSKAWGIQLDGDILHMENQPDFGLIDQDRNRARGLFRTAFKMGPVALGGQVQAVQTDLTLKPGTYYGAQIVSGKGTGTGINTTGGLLFCFPADPRPQQDRFIIGGAYNMEIVPGESKTDIGIQTAGPVTVHLTQTFTSSNAQSFGPELYFEVPNVLQAGLVVRITNFDISRQEDSSDTAIIPSQASFKFQGSNVTSVVTALKMRHPLFKLTSLKTGTSFFFQSSSTNSYDPAQTVTATTTAQSWQFQIGTGVEELEKYTVGLEAQFKGITGNIQPATGSSIQSTNIFSYQFSLGGEKWLDKQWAFRTGIIYDNSLNTGALLYQGDRLVVPSGQRVVATTITAGPGFKSQNFHADFALWFNQPFLYDSPNPNDFATGFGLQLSASILFN